MSSYLRFENIEIDNHQRKAYIFIAEENRDSVFPGYNPDSIESDFIFYNSVHLFVNLSINCITVTPSSPLQGFGPSSIKYSTTFSIIGCCTCCNGSNKSVSVFPFTVSITGRCSKKLKLIFPFVPAISQLSFSSFS